MLLFLILLVGSILFTYLTIESNKDDFGNMAVQMISLFASVGFIICFIIVLFNTLNALSVERTGYYSTMEEYHSIEYKIKNLNSYVYDFDMNKANVIDEIQEWNKNVKEKQAFTHNAFTGCMVPNFWDDIPTFDYDEVYHKINEANKDRGIF